MLLRIVALLLGVVLVLGGGVCTVVGVPVGLMSLSTGGVQILGLTAIGFALLLVGLRLLKFGRGKSKPESIKEPGGL